MWRQLYDDLCGICHPTAFSLIAGWKEENGVVEIGQCDDSLQILALCQKYEATISSALSLSVTTSMMNLNALNWFSLPETKSFRERWKISDCLRSLCRRFARLRISCAQARDGFKLADLVTGLYPPLPESP
jgi:hypothetical protein